MKKKSKKPEMPYQQKRHLVTLGHSIARGCKFGGLFDSISIESSYWEKPYYVRIEKYLQQHANQFFLEKFLHVYLQAKKTNQLLSDRLFAALEATQETVNLIKKQLETTADSTILRGLLSLKYKDYMPIVINRDFCHNGKRALGFSSIETTQNSAKQDPIFLRNLKSLPDTIITHLGVNDLRQDQRPTRIILDGSQYLDKLKGNDDMSDEMLNKTCEYLSKNKGYGRASIDIFKHWFKHGIDASLLKMSIQIYSLNIRLAHSHAYVTIGKTISEKIIKAIEDDEAINKTEIKALKTEFHLSFYDKITAYMKLYEASKLSNPEVIKLHEAWNKIHALYYKKPGELSAAEYLAEGNLEAALASMSKYGYTEATDMLSKLNSGELTGFNMIDTLINNFASLTQYLPVNFLHLINPAFFQAFGLFTDNNVTKGYDMLNTAWNEVASVFHHSFTLDLSLFTKTHSLDFTNHADGIHWHKENYKDVSTPIAMALIAIDYGVELSKLQTLVQTAYDNLKQPALKTKPSELLKHFTDQLTQDGYQPLVDQTQNLFHRVFQKMKFSKELTKDCLRLLSQTATENRSEKPTMMNF